jgi:hypothetical protein
LAHINEEDEDLTSFKPTPFGSVQNDEVEEEKSDDEEEEDDEDDESEEEPDDEDASEEDDEEEEDDNEALMKLDGFVSNLGRDKKRAAEDDGDEHTPKKGAIDEREASKKRRRLMLARERNEALPEGEFYAGGSSGKLTIDSLLSTLDTAQASALKQSLKPLITAAKRGKTTVEDATSAIEAELSRLTADEQALLAKERRTERTGNPLKACSSCTSCSPPSAQN